MFWIIYETYNYLHDFASLLHSQVWLEISTIAVQYDTIQYSTQVFNV